jgi:hypothetical protein
MNSLSEFSLISARIPHGPLTFHRVVCSDRGVAPEVSRKRPVLYSFRDVVALRTCVFLRKDSSLQRVRLAIGNLRSLGELEHLSEYTLVTDNKALS